MPPKRTIVRGNFQPLSSFSHYCFSFSTFLVNMLEFAFASGQEVNHLWSMNSCSLFIIILGVIVMRTYWHD